MAATLLRSCITAIPGGAKVEVGFSGSGAEGIDGAEPPVGVWEGRRCGGKGRRADAAGLSAWNGGGCNSGDDERTGSGAGGIAGRPSSTSSLFEESSSERSIGGPPTPEPVSAPDDWSTH